MTLGRKTGGRDFEPGKSGNPKGRPPLPPELKKIKALNKDVLKALIAKYGEMSIDQLREVANDSTTPALEMTIASIYMAAISNGDYQRLNFLLDRTIGKVTEKKEVEITPVTYRTQVRGDGSLIQEVLDEDSEAESYIDVEADTSGSE